MIINHNMASLNTYNKLSANTSATAKSLEKLSSGLRINKAGDDAAGLAISEKMRGQIRGLDQASRNSQDAISLIQTAEGSLSETHSILQRMRELATQAASDTNVSQDRGEMQKELNQLTSEINRIGNTTEFNTQKLLNGGTGKTEQIRYTVATQGADGPSLSGAVSAVSEQTKSVAAGLGAVTKTQTTASVAAPTIGVVSAFNKTADSIAGGTGVVGAFTADVAGVKEAKAGTIGSPTIKVQSSIGTSLGAISAVTELTVGNTATKSETSTAAVAAKAGVDNYKVTTLFVAGDTFAIGGQTFTAKAGVAVAASGEFSIDTDINAQVASLKLAVDANATLAAKYTITSATDTLTLTETNTLDGTPENAGAATVVGTGVVAANPAQTVAANAIAGVQNYKLTAQFGDGQTIKIGTETFTAKASGANAASGEFNIGVTIDATVANLKTAVGMNATIAADFTASSATDTLTLTETNTTDGILKNAGAATLGAGTAAQYGFEVRGNFSAGDTLKIGTQTFTAKTSGAIAANGEFDIGADIATTVTNIKAAIEANNGVIDTNYSVATTDPKWLGNNDNSLLVFTQKAVGVDANKASMNASAVTQVGAQLGTYKFEIKTNFEAGQKIKVAGVEFTATAAGTGLDDATHFQVGADVAATAAKLNTALAASSLNATYNFAIGTGIYSDTITLTEKVASGTDLAVDASKFDVTNVTEVKGSYKLDLTTQFAAGDKINIGGQDFIAKASGADTNANEFNIGADATAAIGSLVTAVNANATLNANFVASGSGTKLTMTEKVADGVVTDISALNPTITQRTAVKGAYNFDITTKPVAGEKITVGGQEFTAKNGGVLAAGEFDISGADTTAVATSLRLAMTAKLTTYDTTGAGSNIILTEKVASGSVGAMTGVAIAAQGEKLGDYTLKLTHNFSVGDKITIGGQDFTAQDSTGSNSTSTFKVGADANETTENIQKAIEANAALNGNGAGAGRFVSTVVSTQVDPFTVSKSLSLVEKSGKATGVDLLAPAVVQVSAVNGVYNFAATKNFTAGETLTIGGQQFAAQGSTGTNSTNTFKVGADTAETIGNIKLAIEQNTILKNAYTVSTSGSSIALTEKTATGVALANAAVSKAAGTAGSFQFQTSALGAGASISVDGTALTLKAGGTEIQTAAELKTLIEADSTLKTKYDVAVKDLNVTLTQKTGQETAKAPTLTSTTIAGSGFVAQLQIGANTGQGMVLDVKDMRSKALGISETTAQTNQTVEVGGKQYAVAWTDSSTVTSGSDSISTELALDISSHDKATAAVKIIDTAINAVSSERAKMGAYQNRLEHTIANLGTSSENMTGAESRIRDVDMAKEMMQFQKNNILAQAATAMLAQANQQPQGVLQLLR